MSTPGPRVQSAERSVFFTDAVVAIAMTLLILPLMESVAESARDGMTTVEWLGEHGEQIFSFLLSFFVITTFWVMHRNIWGRAESMTGLMSLLNTVWLLAVVWLPVATALAGSMPTDRLQAVLYVGPMVVASACMAGVAHELVRHPELLVDDSPTTGRGVQASVSLAVLYAAALLLVLVFPALGYSTMFLLLLMLPVMRWLRRRSA